PATANVLGKLANGVADDFLSTLYLATRAPVLVAPSMNTQMFAHEAVRANLDTLAARGVRFVEPGEGYLACGWIGKGRLAEPDEIVAAVLARADDMQVVVMAAAVADYAPAERASQKVPKGGETLTLVLNRTPDILADLGERRRSLGRGPLLVGFAAETEHVVARA